MFFSSTRQSKFLVAQLARSWLDLRHAREHIFPDVLPATPETGDWFGYSLAAGDFNGDGLDDLAVGAPGVAFNGQGAAGAVFLFYSAGSNRRHRRRINRDRQV